jgi:hypothetical protein
MEWQKYRRELSIDAAAVDLIDISRHFIAGIRKGVILLQGSQA